MRKSWLWVYLQRSQQLPRDAVWRGLKIVRIIPTRLERAVCLPLIPGNTQGSELWTVR
jgi:hypothetical protein